MKTKYQLIFLGQQNPLRADIEGAFFKHINELGLNADEDKDYVACTEHERATFCDVVQSYSKVLSGSEMFFPVNRTDHNSISAPEQASTCS